MNNVMDRYDYIYGIYNYIKGITGSNYQQQIKDILKIYYQHNNMTFEMPDYYGGDHKNDGWVIEKAIFYQIYAPTRLKTSLKKEMQEKFKEDLEGLLDNICNRNEWNGEISEFIFIVNTFDGNLPQDSERFFDNTVNKFKEKFNINFQYKVVNSEYIIDLLNELEDIEILKRISASLQITGMIDYNAVTEKAIFELINEISANICNIAISDDTFQTYERTSSTNKIVINKLTDKKDEIERIISKLDTVEKAINNINQDILFENKFERVKIFIITKYNELSLESDGIQLYHRLIDEVCIYTNNKKYLKVPMKFLVVYIFDKCDIFKKE